MIRLFLITAYTVYTLITGWGTVCLWLDRRSNPNGDRPTWNIIIAGLMLTILWSIVAISTICQSPTQHGG